MRPSLDNLPKRAAGRARAAAEGSATPAGQEPPSPAAASTPGAGERAAMRRRARRLRRTREVLLRELGALVVETRRLQRDNPELIARKASEVTAIDAELRALRVALDERQPVATLVAAGIAGSCARCRALIGSEDRFCSSCGMGVASGAAPEDAPASVPPAEAAVEAGPAAPVAAPPPAAAAPPPPPPPAAPASTGDATLSAAAAPPRT